MDHAINPYFPQLRQIPSSRDLAASPLYRRLRPEIDRVLNTVETGEDPAGHSGPARSSIRAVAWNIERGLELPGLTRALREHPRLREADTLLLTELDYGMARTGNLHVTRELARRLGMTYVFAPSYLNLDKGAGLENEAPGENDQALHGNALLSRHPVSEPHALPLPNGKDKLRGNEKRLGCQRAILGLVEHPLGRFRAVSLHLDAHSSQAHRHLQMTLVLDHLQRWHPSLPVVIGGDWNTSTHHARRAVYSILGYARRVLMGIENTLDNHYPHPHRWFERRLFRELENRGYRYRDLNQMGACTLHYDIANLATNRNMAEWIPNWCFWFINWALKNHQGRCSMKLDWFAGKGILPDPQSPPRVIGGLEETFGKLSDHDPILLDFRLGQGVFNPRFRVRDEGGKNEEGGQESPLLPDGRPHPPLRHRQSGHQPEHGRMDPQLVLLVHRLGPEEPSGPMLHAAGLVRRQGNSSRSRVSSAGDRRTRRELRQAVGSRPDTFGFRARVGAAVF